MFTPVTAYANTTTPTDFLTSLQRTLNVSRRTLIIIGVVAIVVLIIILVLLIYCIKKCLKGDTDKRKKRKTQDEKDIFLDDFSKYESEYGYIDFSVTYDRKRKRLIIRDVQVNNLKSPSPDPPDCFLKVFLKNDKGKKINIKTTKPKIDNYTPYFNETFSYTFESITNAVVYFQVIDDNPNGSDILLGEGVLDMKTIATTKFIGVICQTYIILEKPTEKDGYGDVCVVLTVKQNKIKIVLLEAKGLVYKYAKNIFIGTFKYPSVHAEVHVFKKRNRIKHFVTKKLQDTENPYFMESFEVSINELELKNTCIKVQLYESTPSKIQRKIGQIYIGNPNVNSKINSIGKFHWDSACNDLNSAKAMWHSLIH